MNYFSTISSGTNQTVATKLLQSNLIVPVQISVIKGERLSPFATRRGESTPPISSKARRPLKGVPWRSKGDWRLT
ncbi:hypothetical protein H5410_028021 [Solanum commersonii]|uniref:Uncharacterized protein n=1 Tax=Solanum commersonii TaxID=4109 RepID=A0A9J5Z0V8_SOLCO|nr:hypothetical protein H5410_028021 [Solanum commersonii]